MLRWKKKTFLRVFSKSPKFFEIIVGSFVRATVATLFDISCKCADSDSAEIKGQVIRNEPWS